MLQYLHNPEIWMYAKYTDNTIGPFLPKYLSNVGIGMHEFHCIAVCYWFIYLINYVCIQVYSLNKLGYL